VVDFWVAFSEVVIIVRRLIREGWTRYRWEGVAPPDCYDLSAEPLSSTAATSSQTPSTAKVRSSNSFGHVANA
jgi:hypothetical protein